MMQAEAQPALEAGSRLTIDLAALKANYRFLREQAAPAECAGVVKADAYGLGSEEVAKALWDAGARTFFVAHVFEARKLRKILPEAVLYVLNGLAPDTASIMSDIDARPVLGSLAEIGEWATHARAHNLDAHAAIHVDTGMNRLGLSHDEALMVGERHRSGALGFVPTLIMSHLACADTPDAPLNAVQLERFQASCAAFPGVPASLANSAATLSGPAFRFDVCRPGIALYGGNPFSDRPNPLQPVVTLQSRIIQIRDIPEAEGVGYGAAETAKRPSRIAILSLGYADGFLRASGSSDTSKGTLAEIAGQPCPLIGRISMDLIAVDITDLPQGAAARGDFATLIGGSVSLDYVATHAGTISYEVLTRLGTRFERRYIDE